MRIKRRRIESLVKKIETRAMISSFWKSYFLGEKGGSTRLLPLVEVHIQNTHIRGGGGSVYIYTSLNVIAGGGREKKGGGGRRG